MTGRRITRTVVVLLGVAVLGLCSWAPAFAGPGDVVDTGWWSRNPGQAAPEGGVAVALAPDGAVTVAAVRLDMWPGVTAVTLTAVETGGIGQAGAAISVCPADDAWEAVAGGSLGDAPTATCEQGSVAFERDADAETWSADVTSLVAGRTGAVSLALVPSPDQGPLAAFDVRVAAPTTQVTVQIDDPGASEGFGGEPPDDGAQPAFGNSQNVPPASPPATSGSFGAFDPSAPATIAPAAPPSEPAPQAPADGPADNAAPSLPESDEQAFQPLVPASSNAPNHRTVGKALLYVVISAAAGAAVATGSRVARTRGFA